MELKKNQNKKKTIKNQRSNKKIHRHVTKKSYFFFLKRET